MNLKPFDDRDVTECAVRIVRAGDGLSDSLGVAPVELAHGEVVHILLRGEVSKVGYELIKDSDELRRVHTVRVIVGTLVDEEFASSTIDATIRDTEEAAGVLRLGLEPAD